MLDPRCFARRLGADDRLCQLGVRLALDEVERQVHDRARGAPLCERTLHEQLEVGRLADLAGSAQHMDARLGQVDGANELCGQAHGRSGEQGKLSIVCRPALFAPPGVLGDDLFLSEGHMRPNVSIITKVCCLFCQIILNICSLLWG